MDNSSETTPNTNTTNPEPALATEVALESQDDDRSSLITARGTSDGLVIRLDGRVEAASLKEALKGFVQARRSFLAGNDISLEWVGIKPEDHVTKEISELLSTHFSISVKASRLRSQTSKSVDEAKVKGFSLVTNAPDAEVARTQSTSQSAATPAKAIVQQLTKPSLFGGVESLEPLETRASSGSVPWDEPDCRVVYTTLRSGQKIETEYSLVIFGDVNSGAEVIAGGDIIILGTLRGVAHAGAYDESGGGRVIFCLSFQPTQLRIGTVISRGVGEERSDAGRLAEVARVENGMIVVESYQARSIWGKRRE